MEKRQDGAPKVLRWTATSLAAAEQTLTKFADQEALRQLARLLDRRAQATTSLPAPVLLHRPA